MTYRMTQQVFESCSGACEPSFELKLAGFWRRLTRLTLLAAVSLLLAGQVQAALETFEGLSEGPNVTSASYSGYWVPGSATGTYVFGSGLILDTGIPNTQNNILIGDFTKGDPSFGLSSNGSINVAGDLPFGTAFLGLNTDLSPVVFEFGGVVHEVSAYVTGDTGTITINGYDGGHTLVATNSIASVDVSQWGSNLLSLTYAPGMTSVEFVGSYLVIQNVSFDGGGMLAEQTSALTSGLPMANAEGLALQGGNQTVTNDINNHLFGLRSGAADDEEDGSIGAAMDLGVVMGEGDGDGKNPVAKRVERKRQWEAYATVNYGNVKVNAISGQAGVQVDSWASGAGIERHVARGLTLGFAFSFLQSNQNYSGGLGSVELAGPALSAYVAYARKSAWASLLYTFGDYSLDTTRNPGLGFPTANGSTDAYTHAVQFNTGYNFRFQNNTLVTGPFTGVDYLHGTVSAYSENGGGLAGLSFAKQTFQSLVSRVGWSVSKKFETSWAVITPQVRLSYERQNLHNNGTSVSLINAPFTAAGGNQSPGQDYMVVGTGVNFQFTPQLSLLLSYQTQIFRNDMKAHFGSVRLGYKF